VTPHPPLPPDPLPPPERLILDLPESQEVYDREYDNALKARCEGCGSKTLLEAAKNGCAACVRKYINETNEVDKKGNTALMIAAHVGSAQCVALLLAQ